MDYSINDNKIIIASADDKETLQYIYNTIYTYNGVIEYTEWQCRYNKRIVYNYKPSYAEAYKLVITLKNEWVRNDYILFLLNKQLKNVEHLEKCLAI